MGLPADGPDTGHQQPGGRLFGPTVAQGLSFQGLSFQGLSFQGLSFQGLSFQLSKSPRLRRSDAPELRSAEAPRRDGGPPW